MKLSRRSLFKGAGALGTAAAATLVIRGVPSLPPEQALRQLSLKIQLVTDKGPWYGTVSAEIRQGHGRDIFEVWAVGDTELSWETKEPRKVLALKLDTSPLGLGFSTNTDMRIPPITMHPGDTVSLVFVKPLLVISEG